MRTVVVGIGNPVRKDDGVGLRVAREVRERTEGQGIDVVELWAGGLRLAEAISGYDRAVVVDAMTTRACPPGTVASVDLSSRAGLRTVSCIHDADMAVALEVWRRAGEPMPREIEIIGIETGETESLGESLTREVLAAVAEAVGLVIGAATGKGRG